MTDKETTYPYYQMYVDKLHTDGERYTHTKVWVEGVRDEEHARKKVMRDVGMLCNTPDLGEDKDMWSEPIEHYSSRVRGEFEYVEEPVEELQKYVPHVIRVAHQLLSNGSAGGDSGAIEINPDDIHGMNNSNIIRALPLLARAILDLKPMYEYMIEHPLESIWNPAHNTEWIWK